ncbi:carbohydrate kinase [Hahella sp. HN01]|uniref:carbohydrate kinase family protein n=1 Tax=Hahella sp. HN01 TaxID=2847262 RepID=UPI001C1E9B65|nr:carbohydrate kinase [Hahella sp. HN01]MBU6952792.1 carbohydrate kinase [Hahella sp. HN01]
MSTVVCFGEALIDFLNIGQDEEAPLRLRKFKQFPGGAPANVAVAIAKLGGDARFAGQVGEDEFGRFLAHALQAYGVDTSQLLFHPTAKTALAFVMLDDSGERTFSFYRDGSADMVLQAEQVAPAWFAGASVFHYCSNTLTTPSIAAVTESALQRAKDAGCVISFDVNLRHNLWASGHADKEVIIRLAASSHLLKLSLDELEYLAAGADSEALCQSWLQQGVKLILVTDGGKPIRYVSLAFSGEEATPPVKAVDTTAAGDSFMGAILFGLSKCGDQAALLNSQSQVAALVRFASQCGALTVSRQGAFPALPDWSEVSRFWELGE